MPGRHFSVTRQLDSGLRLSFAGLETGEIRRGIEALGGVVREALAAQADTGAPVGWV
jgi:DNA-binding transcriptional MocR family regulator